jgi:hypothetical protein
MLILSTVLHRELSNIMKMTGDLYWSSGVEPNSKVIEAIITPKRISIDWSDKEGDWHLEGSSSDGERFKGNYGKSKTSPNFEFELTLFRNRSEQLLFGTWIEHDSGDEGTWALRLRESSST